MQVEGHELIPCPPVHVEGPLVCIEHLALGGVNGNGGRADIVEAREEGNFLLRFADGGDVMEDPFDTGNLPVLSVVEVAARGDDDRRSVFLLQDDFVAGYRSSRSQFIKEFLPARRLHPELVRNVPADTFFQRVVPEQRQEARACHDENAIAIAPVDDVLDMLDQHPVVLFTPAERLFPFPLFGHVMERADGCRPSPEG